jgi:hypothetical protein
MLRFGRALGLVALVVAFVGGTACSGGGGGDLASSNPSAALAAASRNTSKTGSVAMSFSASLGGSKGMSVASGTGAYDFKHESGRFKFDVALGSSIEMVLTADKLYIKQPKVAPVNKAWRGITQEQLAQDPSRAGFLGQLRGQVDPRSSLRNLGTSVKDVHKVAKEKVRGTDTTHIAGTVDLSEAAIAAAPKDAQAGMRQAREAVGADGYPVDVWLDADGRVRRIQYDLAVGTGAARAVTTVRLDLYDFGKDAAIVIPDASDVQEGLD